LAQVNAMNASPRAESSLAVTSPCLRWPGLFGAGLVLSIAAGGFWVSEQIRTAAQPALVRVSQDDLRVVEMSIEEPPLEERVARAAGLKSVRHTVEDGKKVIRIRATADGDELIVDAATGKLLSIASPSPSPMQMAAPGDNRPSDS
jgi:hypothetical protein